MTAVALSPVDSILPRVQHLLRDHFDLATEKLLPDQCLTDLGIDSLAAIEFLFKLEDDFDISLADERGDFRTVADIASIVEKALSAKLVTA
jgi:acyl carrier protein